MRLRLVDYRAVCTGQPTDGSTQFGLELPELLAAGGVGLETIDLASFLTGRSGPPGAGVDAVVSALGPYAYLFHHARELQGWDHPIVRDIHGGLWIGYLMQEWLCAPLTRPGDVIVYPSEFARSLYARLFPEAARTARTVVAHPRFHDPTFPEWRPAPPAGRGPLRVGCIGRMSPDKNLPDVVRAAAGLQRRWPERSVELHLLGGASGVDLKTSRALWIEGGGHPARLVYRGCRLPQEEVDRFYREIDVLAFFSTSNIEALGRVAVEARYWSVRTCMADHGAAGELVDGVCRVSVRYRSDTISCHNGFPMGAVDAGPAVEALERTLTSTPGSPLKSRRFLASGFVGALAEALSGDGAATAPGGPFGWKVSLPLPPDRGEALERIERLLEHFRYWSGLGGDRRGLQDELLAMSTDPGRSRCFLEDVEHGRANYADTNGFPFNLAQVLGLHPTIVPNPEMPAAGPEEILV